MTLFLTALAAFSAGFVACLAWRGTSKDKFEPLGHDRDDES